MTEATRFLGELLDQSPAQLRSPVERSVQAVLDQLAAVAEHQSGREQLYEVIRYSDETVAENLASLFHDRDSSDALSVANKHLGNIDGISKQEDMVASLGAGEHLSKSAAESILACIIPCATSVLKRQITTGRVLDNADGIGQLFLGEGDIDKETCLWWQCRIH